MKTTENIQNTLSTFNNCQQNSASRNHLLTHGQPVQYGCNTFNTKTSIMISLDNEMTK